MLVHLKTNMISFLYHSINKGSFRTLSFLLAILLTLAFFLNIHEFSTSLRTVAPAWILFIFWGVITLWIHGIGFEIRNAFWQLVFLPYLGYFAVLIAIILHVSAR